MFPVHVYIPLKVCRIVLPHCSPSVQYSRILAHRFTHTHTHTHTATPFVPKCHLNIPSILNTTDHRHVQSLFGLRSLTQTHRCHNILFLLASTVVACTIAAACRPEALFTFVSGWPAHLVFPYEFRHCATFTGSRRSRSVQAAQGRLSSMIHTHNKLSENQKIKYTRKPEKCTSRVASFCSPLNFSLHMADLTPINS